MRSSEFGTERPPVWALTKNGKPFTIIHVGADLIDSVDFRQQATNDPYLCCIAGAKIETKVCQISPINSLILREITNSPNTLN